MVLAICSHSTCLCSASLSEFYCHCHCCHVVSLPLLDTRALSVPVAEFCCCCFVDSCFSTFLNYGFRRSHPLLFVQLLPRLFWSCPAGEDFGQPKATKAASRFISDAEALPRMSVVHAAVCVWEAEALALLVERLFFSPWLTQLFCLPQLRWAFV